MKKLLRILIVILCTTKTFGQSYSTPVTDTLSYLRYLVSNKEQFIGKPFSQLHNSLLIDVKMFFPFGGIHYKKNAETKVSLSFKFAPSADDLYSTYPKLVVCWQAPYMYLPVSDSLRMLYERQGVGWNVPLYNRYKDLIIRDIYVHE